MHIDFHYYMTRVLAIKAGFNHEDAHIIAYASQFVDDNVRHNRVVIKNMPELQYGDSAKGNVFKPVCTAHEDVMFVAGLLSRSVDRRTYLPFHYIPETKDGVTTPNGKVARTMVQEVAAGLKNAPSSGGPKERLLRQKELIGLGIALHSYADTWAHREFSAYLSIPKNTVTHYEALTENGWIKGNAIKIWGIFTPVGHANVGALPDMSFLEWRYRFWGESVTRNNPKDYTEAAREVFDILKDASPKDSHPAEWDEFAKRIEDVIKKHPTNNEKPNDKKYTGHYLKFPQLKSADYLRFFPECFPGYDADEVASHDPKKDTGNKKIPYNRYEWVNAAFVHDPSDRCCLTPSNLLKMKDKLSDNFLWKGNYVFNQEKPDYKWLFFHMKADEQRKIIFRELGLTY